MKNSSERKNVRFPDIAGAVVLEIAKELLQVTTGEFLRVLLKQFFRRFS